MPTPAPIPAGHVRITRVSHRYARTRNGAWISAGSDTRCEVVPETQAAGYVGSYGTLSLEYPDGLREELDMVNTPWRFWSSDPAAPTKTSRALGRLGYASLTPDPVSASI